MGIWTLVLPTGQEKTVTKLQSWNDCCVVGTCERVTMSGMHYAMTLTGGTLLCYRKQKPKDAVLV